MLTADTVVNQVAYKHWTSTWHDSQTDEDMVMVIVHVPSGQWKDDYHVKVNKGGTTLSIYEKTPELFQNTAFVEKQARISSSHTKTQNFQVEINNKKLKVSPMQTPCNLMKVNLLFACKETTILQKIVSHKDVDMSLCDLEEKKDLVNLLYIQLKGAKKEYSVGTANGAWRGETYSDSDEAATPVARNTATFAFDFPPPRTTTAARPSRTIPTSRVSRTSARNSNVSSMNVGSAVNSADFSYIPDTSTTAVDDADTITTASSIRSFFNQVTSILKGEEAKPSTGTFPPKDIDLFEGLTSSLNELD